MYDKGDRKCFLSKSEEVNCRKHNLVILVLFTLTCSAFGLSFYALLKVQSISDELNVLRSTLGQINMKNDDYMTKYNDRHNWSDSIEDPNDESLLKQIIGDASNFLERSKRSLVQENADSTSKTDTPTTAYTTIDPSEIPKIHTNNRGKQHHMKRKAVNYEDELEAESFTPHRNIHRYPHRGRNNQLEIIDEFSPQAGRLKTLMAIHFDGDTSKYVYGHHTNFNGNGHLRHPKKTFVDWKVSDWVESIGGANNFDIKDGVVTVKDSGLYFVYAQIYYLDEHDMNGYRVYKNSDIFLQCTKTSHSTEKMMKGNTCYTAAAAYLNANDNISVSDIADGRYSLFEPGKSFFGLIKLGDVKIK